MHVHDMHSTVGIPLLERSTLCVSRMAKMKLLKHTLSSAFLVLRLPSPAWLLAVGLPATTLCKAKFAMMQVPFSEGIQAPLSGNLCK